MRFLLIPFVPLALSLSSCYYDNFRELHPESALPNAANGCDTSGTMSYSVHIVPIVEANCTQSCHNGTGSGHTLTSYADVQNDAANGTFYGSVVQDGTAQAMPQNGSKLPLCDIVKIKKWVDAGAPNN